jgi:ABC-type transport system involved in multi-copper enzyme maturation permease subunit
MKELSVSNALKSVIKYELVWDLRKLKIYISLGIVTALALLVTIYMGSIVHITDKQDYWYISLAFLSTSIFLFLMGAPITMNSISGEFETGTIVPLLARPVSRTEVYFGKAIASLIIVVVEMVILGIILSVVSTIIMGPQANLYRLIVLVLTLATSTMVYAAFTMMLSSVTKNSMASILGSFGVMFALEIGLGIYEMVYKFQTWFLLTPFIGTGVLTSATEEAFQNPNALYSVTLGTVRGTQFLAQINNLQAALLSFGTAIVTIIVFLLIGWIAFKKSDIKD